MKRYVVSRRQVLQGLAATLPASMLGCAAKKSNSLLVGGLPVTCNLTLPVACVSKEAVNSTAPATAPRYEYEYSK